MSISTEISRIQANRNTIRTKLVELGMATGTDNLNKLASAIEGIVNQGAVSVTVQEVDTYTIPAGYHNGSGTVSGVAGGGNYNLIAAKREVGFTARAIRLPAAAVHRSSQVRAEFAKNNARRRWESSPAHGIPPTEPPPGDRTSPAPPAV